MIGKILKLILISFGLITWAESTAFRRSRMMMQDPKMLEASETVWSIIAKGIASTRENSTAAMEDLGNNSKSSLQVPNQPDIITTGMSTSTVERTTEPIMARGETVTSPTSSQSTSTEPTNERKLERITGESKQNKNNEYFYLPDNESQSLNPPKKRPIARERERNTKAPSVRKGKSPSADTPFEKRPALLLRLFPDGTAVLISRFQVQLRVKPKEILFDKDERNLFDEVLPFSPEMIWSGGGKSFEVTYKRLESGSISEKNQKAEQRETEPNNSNEQDINNEDTEYLTPSMFSTEINAKDYPEGTTKQSKEPLQSTEPNNGSKEENRILQKKNSDNDNRTYLDSLTLNTEEPTLFSMHGEQMESLQRQYEPLHAAPLIDTTTLSSTVISPVSSTQSITANAIRTLPSDFTTMEITTTSVPMTTQTAPSTTNVTATDDSPEETTEIIKTPECLSFKNQLSLALSTEDNIGNALLRRHLLPIRDCNTSDGDSAPLASVTTTTTTTTTASPTPPTLKPSQMPGKRPTSSSRPEILPMPFKLKENNHAQNFYTRDDAVMVTSVPMMILLKPRKETITDIPEWKEVTVGVVRDSQGKPIKAKRGYNNWTAHLRNLKKKPSSEFWYETTSPTHFRRSEANDQSIPMYLNNYKSVHNSEQQFFPNNHPQNFNARNDKGLYYNGDGPGNQVRENRLHPQQNRNDPQSLRFREHNVVNQQDEPHRNPNRNGHNQLAEQRGSLRHSNQNRLRGSNDGNSQRRQVGQESRPQQQFTNQNHWRGNRRW